MKAYHRAATACFCALALPSLVATEVLAEKVCIRASNPAGKQVKVQKKVVASSEACPPKYTELLDTSQLIELRGNDGANGSLRIFGDGSAGEKVVALNETLGADAPPFDDSNPQYTDFRIDSGVTLTVPSGAVIRCTGTFTNNGTIVVLPGAKGARMDADLSDTSKIVDSSYAPPGKGVALRVPAAGEFGDGPNTQGGFGGKGIANAFTARSLLRVGPEGGSGGSVGIGDAVDARQGGEGGGTITILAKGGIVNTGLINASGTNGPGAGAGGGGGGVVILASPLVITNTSGVILAAGGNGATGNTETAAGGGGGGGIIHLLSPVINGGTTNVSGGLQGASVAISSRINSGGGGGGASGGDGGNGGGGPSGAIPGSPSSAQAGSPGIAITTEADPTSLF